MTICVLHLGLSDHEILSQAMIFIFAGYETSSATMNFLFYLLATNPDTLKILHDEIDEVFPDKVTFLPLSQGDIRFFDQQNKYYIYIYINTLKIAHN